jgi:hypothetical protein
MIICRKPAKSESYKATEQQPIIMQIKPSMAATSAFPPVAGTCLMACSNADVWHCAQRVLKYVESLKDAEVDQEGNKSSFTTSGYLLFC